MLSSPHRVQDDNGVTNAASDGGRDAARDGVPDWRLITFPVHCPRCGCDLHGRGEPCCPACELQFRWEDLVPAEDMRCLDCNYSLLGLTTLRCPECGRPFTWEELFRHRGEAALPLYEFTRRRRVGRAVATWWLALRPKRLWSRVRLHHEPRPRRLLEYAAMGYALFWLMALTAFTVVWFTWVLRSGAGTASAAFAWLGNRVLNVLTYSSFWFVVASGAVWMLASLGALLMLQDSMSRRRIRFVHAVRVWAYATATFLPLFGLGVVLGAQMDALVPFKYWSFMSDAWYMATGIACVVPFVARSIRVGYSDYLRIDHSRAVAWLTQIIALLIMVLAQFLLFKDEATGVYSNLYYMLTPG